MSKEVKSLHKNIFNIKSNIKIFLKIQNFKTVHNFGPNSDHK